RSGDQQHFVLDDVGQVQLFEHQTQRGAERNALQVTADGSIETYAGRFESFLVELNFDVVLLLEVVDGFVQRDVVERDVGWLVERLQNALFRAALLLQVDRRVLLAAFGQSGPNASVRVNDRWIVWERNVRNVDQMQRVDKRLLRGFANCQVGHVIAGNA